MIVQMRPFKHPPASAFVLESVLYALSDAIRIDIVRRLACVDEASCGELDGGRPKSTVSHHFKVLRECGLVWTRHTGTTHMNALRRDALDRRFPGLLAAILAQSPTAAPLRVSSGDGDGDAAASTLAEQIV